MKHFINDRATIVPEALDLEVMLGEGNLVRLDGYPAIKVVLRADWDKSTVALVSGGGAGHEPAHVGFVGDGMLTAAVCGDIFASPSVDAVLAGILAVTGEAGCLLIVKNYTGDRLNFGLAAERARAKGLKVEMVIVGDDIAIADSPRPRGIAGTLLVHKVAGHVARSGAALAEVKRAAERVASSVRSLGLSLFSGSIPGQGTPEVDRIGPEEVELGLGIHGEPGAEKISFRPVREFATLLASRLEAALPAPEVPLALLINDLGGVSPLEMAVATRSMLAAMKRPVEWVIGPAPLMTSLDMKGLSVSLLPLDAEIEAALTSSVAPVAWIRARRVRRTGLTRPLAGVESESFVPSFDAERRLMVDAACRALVAAEASLNALDAKVGDGDTGTTFATAARTIASELERLPLADAAALFGNISQILASAMGGSSGILLSIGTAAMRASLRESAQRADWGRALHEAARRIQEVGGARAGDRTMLDALLPAVDALQARWSASLKDAALAARRGAEATATMTAKAGRSSYVPEAALRGVSDPGAVAIALVFEALAAARS